MGQALEVEYHVDGDAEAVARRAAQYLSDRIGEAVRARGAARIAISGGNTPKRTFELLAEAQAPYRAQIPWDKLSVYWVDERCVPPNDPDSNFGMTRQALLDKVPLTPDRVFRIQGELDPEEAAAKYESSIRQSFRLEGAQLPVFDLVLLGMGPDGHTASLFPHSTALHELMRIAVANHVAQKDAWRVTLTWPVLNQARQIIFLIEGENKASVLKRVMRGPYTPEELPSQLIQPRNGALTLLLDASAAAQFPPPNAEGLGRLEITR